MRGAPATPPKERRFLALCIRSLSSNVTAMGGAYSVVSILRLHPGMATRERLGEHGPHSLRFAGAEVAHVPAGLVAPRPQVFQARAPGGLDSGADIVSVLR